MKSKQQVFFLTKSDLIKMMSVVEEKVPLEYILMGGICFFSIHQHYAKRKCKT